MSGVKERLENFLKYERVNKSDFGRRIGVSNAFVSSIRKSIQPDKIASIQREFPTLSIDWLLTGEGSMLKSDDDSVTSNDERMIPFYGVESTGGYSGRTSSSEGEGEIAGYIQPGGWFDGMETAAIRHVGDSMVEYPSGCILVVKKVNDRNLLIPGRIYVIETSEYRITKRIQKRNTPETLMLYSTNTEKYEDGRLIHEPFEVLLEDIINIFTVLGYIVNQSGEMKLI